MNIAFAYNVKHNENYTVDANQDDIEFDSVDVINGIEETIKSLGHSVIRIEADDEAFNKLSANKNNIDLVFNIAEGLTGDARESQIPIFCEMLGIPYTHSSPTTHAIKIKKQMTKQLLKSYGVKVPNAQVVTTSAFELDKDLRFPLIVKPHTQGSSKGIFNDSVVHNGEELKRAVARVLDEFDTEALIEEYIEGREFTVGMLGNPPKMLPIIEQRFDFLPENFNRVAGYELKWIYEENLKNIKDGYYCPAPVEPEVYTNIETTSHTIWRALEVRDAARIDYRLNSNNELYFIEINTLPGINPDPNIISYFPLAARISGLAYKELLNEIINAAAKRNNIKK